MGRTMTQPVVHLVERRSSLVPLPVADVRFLVEHARHLIDVRPTFRRGLYELKPLALIGWFDGPSRRFAIRPKLPWPTIQMLLRLGAAQCSEPCQPDNDDLLDILALEFAERLREVIRIGLVAGYREADNIAPFLRGKLRLTEQIHTMTDGGYPHQFSITEDCFDLDTPWNRLPNLVAAQLLNCPGLRTTARMGLLNACSALSHLPLDPVAETEVEHSCSDPRLEHYQPLLSLCPANRPRLVPGMSTVAW